jgi:3,4-dihydroxyphenylacetate 2,3-dioxygenase
LVEAWKEAGVAAVRNEADNYRWDYGTFVPLQYIDPAGEVAVVGVPVVLMADHGECLRAGAAVHATAKKLGKRVVFLASTALSHLLVRGRHNWPTPERVEADKRFIEFLKRGAIDEVIQGFTEYSKKVVAEMGGRALATMVGVVSAMSRDGKAMAARQFGDYAQSSGSNNAVLLIADQDTLAAVDKRVVQEPRPVTKTSTAALAALEETE